MKYARVIQSLLSIVFLLAVLPERLDAADRSVREHVLYMLALPYDRVPEAVRFSIIRENQTTLLGLVIDHAKQGGVLTDTQLRNALSWLGRAPSVEALLEADAIAQTTTNKDIRAVCDELLSAASIRSDTVIRMESSVAELEARLAKGGFSNDLVPIVLARILVRQNSRVGESYLMQALGGGAPVRVLIEASGSLIDGGRGTNEVRAFLRSVLDDRKVPMRDGIRAAQILASVDKEGGMHWLKAQVDQVRHPGERLQLGNVLAQLGDVQGLHMLVSLLGPSDTSFIDVASERALRNCLQDVPEAVSKGEPRKRAEIWRVWFDKHKGSVRWDAMRKKFVCPSD